MDEASVSNDANAQPSPTGNQALIDAFKAGMMAASFTQQAQPVQQAQPEKPKYPEVTDNGAHLVGNVRRVDIPSVF